MKIDKPLCLHCGKEIKHPKQHAKGRCKRNVPSSKELVECKVCKKSVYDLKQHLLKNCKGSKSGHAPILVCKYCEAPISQKLLVAHENSCLLKPVSRDVEVIAISSDGIKAHEQLIFKAATNRPVQGGLPGLGKKQ
jgi:hypothetical protein